MVDEPEDELPVESLTKHDATIIAALVALVLGLWVGGTLLAHWIWNVSWIVAALLVPAAVLVLLALFKLTSKRKRK